MTAPQDSELPESPPWLRSAADTALDAIVIIDLTGHVVVWNRHAELTFGWSHDEAIGRRLSTLIVPPALREKHEGGLRRLLDGGAPHILNQRIEVIAQHKDGHEVPIELAVTRGELGGQDLFIGFLRDIAERKRYEDWLVRRATEAEFLYQATALAAESESFEDALRSCIEIVCRLTGWPIGHALVPDREREAVISSGIWSASESHMLDAFRAASADVRFLPGYGLPGRIWQTGEPLWVAAGINVRDYPRAEVAQALGLLSAFGFPIKIKGRVVAVLEFFTTEDREPDNNLMLLARTIGGQVGRLMERKIAEEQRQVLLNELAHRVKNTLAVVSAIANQTLRNSRSPEAFAQSFQARLHALAQAHSLLTVGEWEHADLNDIVRGALTAHTMKSEAVALSGAPVTVRPKAALALSLVFHELSTNAAKYGALSASDGRVQVDWAPLQADRLRIAWHETGGPAIATPPKAEGYGSTLIKLSVERDIGGEVNLDYAPEGLICEIVVPLNPFDNAITTMERPLV